MTSGSEAARRPPPSPERWRVPDHADAIPDNRNVTPDNAGLSCATRPFDEVAVRAVFVSDLHLGCKHARAEAFLAFLDAYRPQFLYLVGDIIDGWRLRRVWRWGPVYDAILCGLVAAAEQGTLVRYTPGNHDRFLRAFLTRVGQIELADDFTHVTADGRRVLVTHGDAFDRCETDAALVCVLATFGYDVLLNANRWVNALTGRDDYRLAGWVKSRVKMLVRFVSDFERTLAGHAARRRCDGVVCGHVHEPTRRRIGKIEYLNTGDWIEHATALVEHHDGTLELLDFADGTPRVLAVVPPDDTPTMPRQHERIAQQWGAF